MNTLPLDPSRITDGKILRARFPELARMYRRCRVAGLHAERVMPSNAIPSIWESLRPSRASKLACNAATRYRAIASAWYDRYTVAAYAAQGFTFDHITGTLSKI